jgi:uncharacterized Zn-finger protein
MDPEEVPHFHNQIGAALIKIGVKDFMCLGALPPFDHPHVVLNMGKEDEAICPYCATRFLFDASLVTGCDPPECAYPPEGEGDFSAPQPVDFRLPVGTPDSPSLARPRVEPAVSLSVEGRGLIASFASEEALSKAMRELGEDQYELQSYAPTILTDHRGKSFLPKAILIGGLIGACGGFAMESYANILGYPLDIGGSPEFSWPSFMPIAFEIGVLLGVLCGIIGYFIAAGLFNLSDPIDKHQAIRGAMRDTWVVAARSQDLSRRERALGILRRQGGQDIEEIGA